MKKNVREYKNVGVQFGYILDCIYNENNENMSDKEAINYFFDCLIVVFITIQKGG